MILAAICLLILSILRLTTAHPTADQPNERVDLPRHFKHVFASARIANLPAATDAIEKDSHRLGDGAKVPRAQPSTLILPDIAKRAILAPIPLPLPTAFSPSSATTPPTRLRPHANPVPHSVTPVNAPSGPTMTVSSAVPAGGLLIDGGNGQVVTATGPSRTRAHRTRTPRTARETA